jgi:hypothetical protein
MKEQLKAKLAQLVDDFYNPQKTFNLIQENIVSRHPQPEQVQPQVLQLQAQVPQEDFWAKFFNDVEDERLKETNFTVNHSDRLFQSTNAKLNQIVNSQRTWKNPMEL